MKLSFHEPESAYDLRDYPQGYWYAVTDDEGWDASGPDPLTAVSRLVVVLEQALNADVGGAGERQPMISTKRQRRQELANVIARQAKAIANGDTKHAALLRMNVDTLVAWTPETTAG